MLFILKANSAVRVINNDLHPSVGLMRYKGDISCAAFVIRHGVAVTAKHCFDHFHINEDNFDPNLLSISFPKVGGNVDFNNIKVEKQNVYKLILDRGENDIAFILYNRNVTKNEFSVSEFKVNDYSEIESGVEVFRAGFPMGHNTVFDKVITSGCIFTGESGHFDAMVMDQGYEGLLFDTNCPAWFGDSGGPVFSKGEDEQGNPITIIHGVLSHTFEVNFLGEIEESSILEDEIGKYVRTSMFSPFFYSSDLKMALETEESLFNETRIPASPEILEMVENTPNVIEQSKAPVVRVKKQTYLSFEDFFNFLFGFILQFFKV